MKPEELKDFSTVAEVAACFEVSAKTIYREIAAGRIGYVRVGAGSHRITREQAVEYRDKNTHSPTEKAAS